MQKPKTLLERQQAKRIAELEAFVATAQQLLTAGDTYTREDLQKMKKAELIGIIMGDGEDL